MEFGLNRLDIIILSLIMVLSVRGFFFGFIKEVFALLGVIGGVFIASRVSSSFGAWIFENMSLNLSLSKLLAFTLIVIIIWTAFNFIGSLITKPMENREKAILSRIFGFLTAFIRYSFIFAILLKATFEVQIVKDNVKKEVSKSKLYPTFVSVGSYIIVSDRNSTK